MSSLSPAPEHNPKLVAIRARRLRQIIIRGVLLGILMGAGLCGFVLWQRDGARLNEAMMRIQPFVQPLQVEIERMGTFPLYHPVTKVGKVELKDALVYPPPETIIQLRKHQGPIMLAHGMKGPRLFLQANGRPVVMAEGTRIHTKWVSNSEWIELLRQQSEFVEQKLAELATTAPPLP